MCEIELRIKQIIRDNVDWIIPIDQVENDIELFTIGLYSINLIKVVIAVEEEFGIEFEDEQLTYEKFTDLNQFIAYVKKKILWDPADNEEDHKLICLLVKRKRSLR